MLKFGIALTFILVMINSALFVAEQQGLPVYEASTTDLGADYNAAELIGSKALTISKEADTVDQSNWIGNIISYFGAIFGLLFKLGFGYTLVIQNIFPLAYSWIATIISAPLIIIQIGTILYLVLEVGKALIPFT